MRAWGRLRTSRPYVERPPAGRWVLVREDGAILPDLGNTEDEPPKWLRRKIGYLSGQDRRDAEDAWRVLWRHAAVRKAVRPALDELVTLRRGVRRTVTVRWTEHWPGQDGRSIVNSLWLHDVPAILEPDAWMMAWARSVVGRLWQRGSLSVARALEELLS